MTGTILNPNGLIVLAAVGKMFVGRSLHSPTFQLNLSRFWPKTNPKHPLLTHDTPSIPPKQHPKHPLLTHDTPSIPPKQPLGTLPYPQKALTLS